MVRQISEKQTMKQRLGSIGLIKDDVSKKILAIRLISMVVLVFISLAAFVGVIAFSCVHGTSI